MEVIIASSQNISRLCYAFGVIADVTDREDQRFTVVSDSAGEADLPCTPLRLCHEKCMDEKKVDPLLSASWYVPL